MKKLYPLYVLVMLAILFVPLAYIYAVILFIIEFKKNKQSSINCIKDNKGIIFILLWSFILTCICKYTLISSFYLLMLLICILACILVCIYYKSIDKKAILALIYITTLITYFIGLWQMLDDSFYMPIKWVDTAQYNVKKRMFSTFFNPNVYGFYIDLVILCICVNLQNTNKTKGFRILELSTFVISIICLFFTFSRTSWIALIVSLLAVGVFFDRRLLIYGIGIGIILYGMDCLLKTDRTDISKIPMDSSVSYRIELWQTSLKIIKDNLITGIGFGTFYKYTSEYSDVIKHYIEHCHNIYLQICMETGAIGFVGFVIIVLKAVKDSVIICIKDRDNQCSKLVILIMCMTLIHGLVDSVSLTPQIMLILACLAGAAMSEYQNKANTGSISV